MYGGSFHCGSFLYYALIWILKLHQESSPSLFQHGVWSGVHLYQRASCITNKSDILYANYKYLNWLTSLHLEYHLLLHLSPPKPVPSRDVHCTSFITIHHWPFLCSVPPHLSQIIIMALFDDPGLLIIVVLVVNMPVSKPHLPHQLMQ